MQDSEGGRKKNRGGESEKKRERGEREGEIDRRRTD